MTEVPIEDIGYEPLATTEEVQARLEFDMDPEELRICTGAILDASDLVRGEGLEWPRRADAPRIARVYTINAVLRYLRNPEGFVRDKTEVRDWTRTDQGEGGHVYLLGSEKKKLQAIAAGASTGFGITQTYTWSNASTTDSLYYRRISDWDRAAPILVSDSSWPFDGQVP